MVEKEATTGMPGKGTGGSGANERSVNDLTEEEFDRKALEYQTLLEQAAVAAVEMASEVVPPLSELVACSEVAGALDDERAPAAYLILPEDEDGNYQVLEFTWEWLEGRPIDEIANDLLDRVVEVCEEEDGERE
jgi:hypothetical protein